MTASDKLASTVGASCASTVVTELLSALASHSGATFSALYPKLAVGTLFELLPSHELNELLVFIVEFVVDAVLLAAHPVVVLHPALQAVVLVAGWALVVVQLVIELKSSRATGSGAPGCRVPLFLHEFVKGEPFVLFLELLVDVLENISCLEHFSAVFHWTEDISLVGFNFGLEVRCDAFWVENVPALQNPKGVLVNFRNAYGTLPALGVGVFSPTLVFSLLLVQKGLKYFLIFDALHFCFILSLPLVLDEVRVDHAFFHAVLQSVEQALNFFRLRASLIQSLLVKGIDHHHDYCLGSNGLLKKQVLESHEELLQLEYHLRVKWDGGSCNSVPEEGVDETDGTSLFNHLQEARHLLLLLFS